MICFFAALGCLFLLMSNSPSRELRALVVEMVLATDMSCHFQQVKAMKNFLQQPEGSVSLLSTRSKRLCSI